MSSSNQQTISYRTSDMFLKEGVFSMIKPISHRKLRVILNYLQLYLGPRIRHKRWVQSLLEIELFISKEHSDPAYLMR